MHYHKHQEERQLQILCEALHTAICWRQETANIMPRTLPKLFVIFFLFLSLLLSFEMLCFPFHVLLIHNAMSPVSVGDAKETVQAMHKRTELRQL